jgi:hypothetical protein
MSTKLACAAALLLAVACGQKIHGPNAAQLAAQIRLAPAAVDAERLYFATDGSVIASAWDSTQWIDPVNETPLHRSAGWPLTSRPWPAPYLTWTAKKSDRRVAAPDGYRIVAPGIGEISIALPALPAVDSTHVDDDLWMINKIDSPEPQWIVHDTLWSPDNKHSFIVFYDQPQSRTWIVKLDISTWKPVASAVLTGTPYRAFFNEAETVITHGQGISMSRDGATIYLGLLSKHSVVALATTDLGTRWQYEFDNEEIGGVASYEQVVLTVAENGNVMIGSGRKLFFSGALLGALTVIDPKGKLMFRRRDLSGFLVAMHSRDGLDITMLSAFTYSTTFDLHGQIETYQPYFLVERVNMQHEGAPSREIFKESESPCFGASAMLWDGKRNLYWIAPTNIDGLRSAMIVSKAWHDSKAAEKQASLDASVNKRPRKPDDVRLFFSAAEVWLKIKDQPTKLRNLTVLDRQRLVTELVWGNPVDEPAILAILRSASRADIEKLFAVYDWNRVRNALSGDARLQFETEFPDPK